jgi:hypothetical protein
MRNLKAIYETMTNISRDYQTGQVQDGVENSREQEFRNHNGFAG